MQHWKKRILAKNDVEGLSNTGENPLRLPMDSREGSIVSLSPMFELATTHSREARIDSNGRNRLPRL